MPSANANLYALFEDHFPDGAEEPCVIVPNGPVVHYDEIAADSARIAHALVAAGARAGDRVAVQTDKHWQVLPLYLACLRAGLVYLPLNTGYQRSELKYFFDDAEPRVIVCRPEAEGVVAPLATGAKVLTIGAAGGSLVERSRSCANGDLSTAMCCCTRYPFTTCTAFSWRFTACCSQAHACCGCRSSMRGR